MKLILVCLTLFALEFPTVTFCQTPPIQSPTESASQQSADQTTGIPIAKLIEIVARKTGKKVVLDPRVRALVQLVGEDINHVSYPDLLAILHVYGYAAVESGGLVLVIPNVDIRSMPIPTLSGKETFPDYQYVSAVIPVNKLSAPSLIPLLRPLVPTYGQLAAEGCTNSIVMIDTYANVRRIESLIKVLDIGEPYKSTKCEPPQPKP
jgi:general secretion pathway protein D